MTTLSSDGPSDSSSPSVDRPLDSLNFFLADVRDGLGPYLAIYLLSVQKWDEFSIGLVMTIGGIAGIIAQTPAGALIDRTPHKRALLIFAAVAVTICSVVLPFLSSFGSVAFSQVITGAVGSLFQPALAAVTLGLVGPRIFAKRNGRNEAFNHAGNAVAAALAGSLAWWFGPVAVFYLMAAMAFASILSMLTVPFDRIDHRKARGLSEDSGNDAKSKPSGLRVLLTSRPLLIFALCVVLFHFANAAMLPLVGQKLALAMPELATTLMSICIVVAQLVMVPVALLVGAKANAWGRKPLFLAGLAVLTARGFLYIVSDNPYWLVAVQSLDGVGAGIFGALFPIIVNDLTEGTGHFNVSQGAIVTALGIGASLSTAIAGSIVVLAGYTFAFAFLGCVGAIAFAMYVCLMPETCTISSHRNIER